METNKKYRTLYRKFVEASRMSSWWNPALNIFAEQLSKGVLNEIEIERHNKRKVKPKKTKHTKHKHTITKHSKTTTKDSDQTKAERR